MNGRRRSIKLGSIEQLEPRLVLSTISQRVVSSHPSGVLPRGREAPLEARLEAGTGAARGPGSTSRDHGGTRVGADDRGALRPECDRG